MYVRCSRCKTLRLRSQMGIITHNGYECTSCPPKLFDVYGIKHVPCSCCKKLYPESSMYEHSKFGYTCVNCLDAVLRDKIIPYQCGQYIDEYHQMTAMQSLTEKTFDPRIQRIRGRKRMARLIRIR